MNCIDDALFQPELPVVNDKKGVLVIRGEPCDDLTDVVRRERDCRVIDLVQQLEPED